MSEEKLTIEGLSTSIFSRSVYDNDYAISQVRADLIMLLEQIRDELIKEFDFSHNEVRYERLHEPLEKVFNKYINEKGGKE